MVASLAKSEKRVKHFEEHYKNIDMDALHERLNLVQTKLELAERERVYINKVLQDLIGQINGATKKYLKLRKAKELENDLPPDDTYSVDNRNWRKLLEMERQARKIIEEVSF